MYIYISYHGHPPWCKTKVFCEKPGFIHHNLPFEGGVSKTGFLRLESSVLLNGKVFHSRVHEVNKELQTIEVNDHVFRIT